MNNKSQLVLTLPTYTNEESVVRTKLSTNTRLNDNDYRVIAYDLFKHCNGLVNYDSEVQDYLTVKYPHLELTHELFSKLTSIKI